MAVTVRLAVGHGRHQLALGYCGGKFLILQMLHVFQALIATLSSRDFVGLTGTYNCLKHRLRKGLNHSASPS